MIKEQDIYAAMVKDKLDDISKTAINRHLGGECDCLMKITVQCNITEIHQFNSIFHNLFRNLALTKY